MSGPSQFYLDHIHAVSSGYRATWDPALPLQVGDLVKIDDYGVVNTHGVLADKGIHAVTRTSTSPQDMKLSSQQGIEVNVKAAGKAPAEFSALADLDAGFNIKFGDKKAVLFNISGYKTTVIINLDEIEAAVLSQYRDKTWDADLLIITHLIEADSATIIISDKGAASIDLKATANITAADIKLTDTSLKLSVARETGSTLQFIAKENLTPLYKVMGLKGSFFGLGKKHLDTRELVASDEEPEAEDVSFVQIEPEYVKYLRRTGRYQ
jgi:hypothetical protein